VESPRAADRHGDDIAIAVISSVPRTRAPRRTSPMLATWSERIAIWGLHSVPNRNSRGVTDLEEAHGLETSDSTMPIVTRIASVEDSEQHAAQEPLDVHARCERRPHRSQRERAAR
jgi:hypothetical protein